MVQRLPNVCSTSFVETAARGGVGHGLWNLPHVVGLVMVCGTCRTWWGWSWFVEPAARGGVGHGLWNLPHVVGLVMVCGTCRTWWG
jgi:hypothetical protein